MQCPVSSVYSKVFGRYQLQLILAAFSPGSILCNYITQFVTHARWNHRNHNVQVTADGEAFRPCESFTPGVVVYYRCRLLGYLGAFLNFISEDDTCKAINKCLAHIEVRTKEGCCGIPPRESPQHLCITQGGC